MDWKSAASKASSQGMWPSASRTLGTTVAAGIAAVCSRYSVKHWIATCSDDLSRLFRFAKLSTRVKIPKQSHGVEHEAHWFVARNVSQLSLSVFNSDANGCRRDAHPQVQCTRHSGQQDRILQLARVGLGIPLVRGTLQLELHPWYS